MTPLTWDVAQGLMLVFIGVCAGRAWGHWVELKKLRPMSPGGFKRYLDRKYPTRKDSSVKVEAAILPRPCQKSPKVGDWIHSSILKHCNGEVIKVDEYGHFWLAGRDGKISSSIPWQFYPDLIKVISR